MAISDYLKALTAAGKEYTKTQSTQYTVPNTVVHTTEKPALTVNPSKGSTTNPAVANMTGRTLNEIGTKPTSMQIAENKVNNLGGISTSYTPASTAVDNSWQSAYSAYMAELERQRAERRRRLDSAYNSGKDKINRSAADGNKQAYVAYMQGLKSMPQVAAMYGNGGMVQSLLNKSQLNYENNRNNIETAKINALADLDADYRAESIAAGDKYLTSLADVTKEAVSNSRYKTDPVYTATIDGTGVVHKSNNEDDLRTALWDQLKGMGLSTRQITKYLKDNGYVD